MKAIIAIVVVALWLGYRLTLNDQPFRALIAIVVVALSLCYGVFVTHAQKPATPTPAATPTPTPTATPKPTATPTPTPVALSIVQMQQLTIVQREQALAAESLARAQAQYRALVAEFRWQLGVNPTTHEGDLAPLDQQQSVWGFLPKPALPPQPPEPKK